MIRPSIFSYVLIFLLFFSCDSADKSQSSSAEKVYPNQVGDIEFDASIDGDFKTCSQAPFQYSDLGGLSIEGEMAKIKSVLYQAYDSSETPAQTGFVTIRFIVNCEGKTGMFRIFGTDTALKETTFDKSITDQLISATKVLDGWGIPQDESGNTYDYYVYLGFKIVKGKLTEIMP